MATFRDNAVGIVLWTLMMQIVMASGNSAVLRWLCDDRSWLYVSRDGGSTWDQEFYETSWNTVRTVTIDDVSSSEDLIRVECKNVGGAAAFMATMTYQSVEYHTTNPLDDGRWTVVADESISTSLVYGSNQYWTHAGGSDDAYRVWTNNNQVGTMVFEFEFPDTGLTDLSWEGWGGRDLPECAGDCDNDSHCDDGLYCYHDGVPPGCTGTPFTDKADYCFKVPASTGELVWFSWYQTGGLNACQGDCNDDDDCSGDLQCYHNAGKKGVDVPGCTGTPTDKEDYCYNPNYVQDGAAADGFASGHSDDEPAEDMEPDHAASDEEALSFNDLIMMMVGAAIGGMVVAGIVAFVVLMKRKRSGKKEETEMAKVVHVAEVSPASVDGVETV